MQKMGGQPTQHVGLPIQSLSGQQTPTQSKYFHFQAMKTPRHFEKLSTSAGLLVLGTGFVSLGGLSFINRHLEDAGSGLSLDSAYPIVGSLISILLGCAFFGIALLVMARRCDKERAPWPVGEARDLAPNSVDESFIGGPARPRHSDSFGAGVGFRRRGAALERLALISYAGDL
jgi:hypothetical protein